MRDERGFTLIELVVGLTLLVTVFLGLAKATDGGLRGVQAVRQRSSFTELASAKLESLRATSFDSLAIGTTTSTGTASGVPYTVAVAVSWSDATQQIKKIDVNLSWTGNGGSARHVDLSTLRYPGGKGVLHANQQPAAVLSATPTSGHAPLSVAFDASGSTDPDGTIASYAWQFGDGATGAGAATSHTYNSTGTFTAMLTVTDNGGLTSVASTTITLTTNHAPVASMNVIEAGLTVNVDASASTDADSDPLTYTWTFGDGATATGVTASHTYSTLFNTTNSSNWQIKLTVSDGWASASTTNTPCLISVGSMTPNKIPLKANGTANSSLAFSATSNSACTSLSVSLPSNTGTYTVALSKTGSNPLTWTKSATPGNTYTWTPSGNFTGTYTGSGGTILTFPFTT